MNTPRKPLSSILPDGNGGSDDILDQFDAAEVADELGPIPKGVYVALAVGGRLDKAQTGTDSYTIEFRVIEGEYTGRRLWMPKYITPAALPYTKRDLLKFGIDRKEKLHQPFPANRFVCKLHIVLRKLDDDTERNEIRNFEVIRVEEPQTDPFAPEGGGPSDGGDATFPFGANEGEKP